MGDDEGEQDGDTSSTGSMFRPGDSALFILTPAPLIRAPASNIVSLPLPNNWFCQTQEKYKIHDTEIIVHGYKYD